MFGHSPISATPISDLPDVSIGELDLVGTAFVEARPQSPLADIVGNPRQRYVLAIEITTVPIGP